MTQAATSTPCFGTTLRPKTWIRLCAISQRDCSESSSSTNAPNTRQPTPKSVMPAAETWNGHPTFNLNQRRKGGANDSTETIGPKLIPVLNRSHRSHHIPDRSEAVEKKDS